MVVYSPHSGLGLSPKFPSPVSCTWTFSIIVEIGGTHIMLLLFASRSTRRAGVNIKHNYRRSCIQNVYGAYGYRLRWTHKNWLGRCIKAMYYLLRPLVPYTTDFMTKSTFHLIEPLADSGRKLLLMGLTALTSCLCVTPKEDHPIVFVPFRRVINGLYNTMSRRSLI